MCGNKEQRRIYLRVPLSRSQGGAFYGHPAALLLRYYSFTTALLGARRGPFYGHPRAAPAALLLLYYCIIGGSQDPFYGHPRAAPTSTSVSAAPTAAHTRMSSGPPPAAAGAPAAVSASAEGVCESIKGNLAAAGGDGRLGGIASGMMIDRDNSTAARNPAPELKMGRFS